MREPGLENGDTSPFVGINARSYTSVMAITSNCALCGTLAVLIDSHFLPKALYRLIRDNTMKNPNPELVTKGKDVQTSSQMKRYLLCSVCEDLFSKNGESWVLARCFRGGPANKFLLRDMLRTATPMKSDSRGDLVSTVGIVGMDIGKIAYFAASVFWRASVSDWPIQGKVVPQISLGALQEEFAAYLLGKSQFPTSCNLLVYVAGDPTPPLAMHPPQCGNSGNLEECRFSIPGIRFSLLPKIPQSELSLMAPPHHPLLISNDQSRLLAEGTIKLRCSL